MLNLKIIILNLKIKNEFPSKLLLKQKRKKRL